MTCIKFCFFLVFLAIFATIFAKDVCKEELPTGKKVCDKCNIVEFVDAVINCYDGERCIEKKTKQSPECVTCLVDSIFDEPGIEDDWCQCAMTTNEVNRETMEDHEKAEKALKKFGTYVVFNCPEAIDTLKAIAEPAKHKEKIAETLKKCQEAKKLSD